LAFSQCGSFSILQRKEKTINCAPKCISRNSVRMNNSSIDGDAVSSLSNQPKLNTYETHAPIWRTHVFKMRCLLFCITQRPCSSLHFLLTQIYYCSPHLKMFEVTFVYLNYLCCESTFGRWTIFRNL